VGGGGKTGLGKSGQEKKKPATSKIYKVKQERGKERAGLKDLLNLKP